MSDDLLPNDDLTEEDPLDDELVKPVVPVDEEDDHESLDALADEEEEEDELDFESEEEGY